MIVLIDAQKPLANLSTDRRRVVVVVERGVHRHGLIRDGPCDGLRGLNSGGSGCCLKLGDSGGSGLSSGSGISGSGLGGGGLSLRLLQLPLKLGDSLGVYGPLGLSHGSRKGRLCLGCLGGSRLSLSRGGIGVGLSCGCSSLSGRSGGIGRAGIRGGLFRVVAARSGKQRYDRERCGQLPGPASRIQ